MNPEQMQELIESLQALTRSLENPPESSAVQILLSLVPMIGIIFGSTLIFFFFLWNYRLKQELIKTGQYRQTSVKNLRLFALLIGILSATAGLPMAALFYFVEGISYLLLGGLIPFFTGIGLLGFYILTHGKE